jgi:aspartyl/asparaginyl beta-hydroxylase (cupin superfamily)
MSKIETETARNKMRDPRIRQSVQHLVEELVNRFGTDEMSRIIECLQIVTGEREPAYADDLQRPGFLFFPDVSSKPFYDPRERPSLLALVDVLERSFPRIRAEAMAVANRPAVNWLPYVEGDYMVEKFPTVRRDAWSSYSLRRNGLPVEENRLHCPATAAALDGIASHLTANGEAFFSLLEPGTLLPPHHDDSNIKLTVHLPLVIPDGCGIRVGRETRNWEEGRCLIFDDTFEHEAWNRSQENRICLLIDIWHPALTPAEIAALQVLTPIVDAAG